MQDLKCVIFSLISLHFKIKPIGPLTSPPFLFRLHNVPSVPFFARILCRCPKAPCSLHIDILQIPPYLMYILLFDAVVCFKGLCRNDPRPSWLRDDPDQRARSPLGRWNRGTPPTLTSLFVLTSSVESLPAPTGRPVSTALQMDPPT